MKKYIKPAIELIVIDAECYLLKSSDTAEPIVDYNAVDEFE